MLMGKLEAAFTLGVLLIVAAPMAQAAPKKPNACANTDITLTLTAGKVVATPDQHVKSGCPVQWKLDQSLAGAEWCTWFLDDDHSAFPRRHSMHCWTAYDTVRTCTVLQGCPYTYVGLLQYNNQIYAIEPKIIVDPGNPVEDAKKARKKTK